MRWYGFGVGVIDFVLMCYVFWKYYNVSDFGF